MSASPCQRDDDRWEAELVHRQVPAGILASMLFGDRPRATPYDGMTDHPVARPRSILRASPATIRWRRTIAWLLLAFACLEGFWVPDVAVGTVAELETVELEESSEMIRAAVAARCRTARQPDPRSRMLARRGADSAASSLPGLPPGASPLRTSWGRDLLHRDRRLLI